MASMEIIYSLLKSEMEKGRPESAVRNIIIGHGVQSDTFDELFRRYLQEFGRLRDRQDVAHLTSDPTDPTWYQGPQPNDVIWPALHAQLCGRKGWEDAVDSIDKSSTAVLRLTGSPHQEEFKCRGLVVGYVQSGKTANMSAVIAKAADAGYRLFIVFTGMTDALRNQTQDRLQSELVDPQEEKWYLGTERESDFSLDANSRAILSRVPYTLCVVKKNGSRMERLLNWMRSCGALLDSVPVMIIDDEADQASVNTQKADSPAPINALMRDITATPLKSTYIAYTATPFANVLIDPSVGEDLYPRDFIVALPKPEGYLGAEEIFGSRTVGEFGNEGSAESDIIRLIPDNEVPLVRPANTAALAQYAADLPESLVRAIDYFVLATAARYARGHSDKHSSMLVHTAVWVVAHQLLEAAVSKLIDNRRPLWSGDAAILKEIWEQESARVDSASFGGAPLTFDEIRPHLELVCKRLRTVIDNGESEERLVYADDSPAVVVAVGGNTMSRGLTLEGLVVSYFVRMSTAYDALLQMGRWFGFRPGYADLARVWITKELRGYFEDLALVEQEIREDIEQYGVRDLSPLSFGVRIRCHPALNITAAAKMTAAITRQVAFFADRQQTLMFPRNDPGKTDLTWDAARALVAGALDAGAPVQGYDNRDTIGSIGHEHVVDFLSKAFVSDYDRREADPEAMIRFIEKQANAERLDLWSVVVMHGGAVQPGATEEPGVFNLGLGARHCVERSRYTAGRPDDVAYLKALSTGWDWIADLDFRGNRVSSWRKSDFLNFRRQVLGDLSLRTGVLVLYPIWKDSRYKPTGKASPHRADLGASADLMGFSVIFPEGRDDDDVTQSFVSVRVLPYRYDSAVEVEDAPEGPADE